MVDFCKPGFDLHLRRCDIENLDSLLDDIQIRERRTDEEDANAVVEKQGFLILLPRCYAVRINTTGAAAHAAHAATHTTHTTHAAAHAAHAHAATTHAAAAHATGAAGATGHHRHREIQTTGHEELTNNDLNVGREVRAGDTGDSRTTHTTTAHTTATTAATLTSTLTTTAATTDFDARDREDATTTTLLATTAATAAAAAATLAATTLRGNRRGT